MVPANRQQFKEYILRKLGAPVIQINVEETQIEDRIDTALEYFADYHFDGSQLVYYKQRITPEMMSANGGVVFPMPQNVIGAVEVFPLGAIYSTGNFFNIQYQIALNDLYTLTSQSIVPYFMAFQHIQLLEELLVGQKPIRWNRHEGNLYLDMDTTYIQVGTYVIVKCYQALDPNQFPTIWGDRWLQEYAEALLGIQWGTNLSKFTGIQMPGGVMFNGQQILQRYMIQKERMEEEMTGKYGWPIEGFVG